jgi:nucleoside-diphosphate-sugar epimerase
VRRALVTGGTGFLGMHLATALAEAGFDEVRLLDVVRPEAPLPDPLAYQHGDVRDPDAVTRAASGCEVVVDNAALVPVTRATPEEFDSVNLEGCRVVLDAARAEGAYVVHVSSSSIYGKPPGMPVTEDTPLAPFEPYGASKAKAEVLVEQERASGLVVSSLRSRALLGRGRLGLFELIFSRIHTDKRVPLFGSGRNVLQMCDARDFASAAVACIEQRANADYNIAAGEYATVREDLQALIDLLGSKSRLQPVPVWAIRAVLQPLALVGRSPFTAWHWHSSHATFYTSIEKAEQELDWQPRYSNVDALEHAYHEYVAGKGRGGSAHTTPLPGALARILRG